MPSVPSEYAIPVRFEATTESVSNVQCQEAGDTKTMNSERKGGLVVLDGCSWHKMTTRTESLIHMQKSQASKDDIFALREVCPTLVDWNR